MGEMAEMPAGAAGDPLECFEERLRGCLRHLDKSSDRDTLEPILVRFLLVAACGAYEKTIRGAVDLRMANSGDMEFVRYLGMATEKHKMSFGTVSAKRLVDVLDGLPGTEGMPLAAEGFLCKFGGYPDCAVSGSASLARMAGFCPDGRRLRRIGRPDG